MKMYVLDDEVARCEAALLSLRDGRAAASVELAWHLRQRDTRRALALADQAERELPLSRLSDRECKQLAARVALVRGEGHWLFAELDSAEAQANQALKEFTVLDDALGCADAHWLLGWIASDRGLSAHRDSEWTAMAVEAQRGGDSLRVDVADADLARWSAFTDVQAAVARWGDRFPAGAQARDPAVDVGMNDFHGTVANLSSDYALAATCRMRMYESAMMTGQVRRAIIAATNAGNAFKNLSYPHSALEWLQRGLDLARPTGWNNSIATCLSQTAETMRRLGRLDDAHELLRESLLLLAPLSGSRSYALALEYLGDLLLDRGDFAAALDTFGKLQERADALNQTDFQPVVRRGQAQALSQLGRPQEALVAALDALSLARVRHDAIRQIDALKVLAAIHRQHALPPPDGITVASAPLHFLMQALEVATTVKGYTVPAGLLDQLSREYADLGDYQRAYEKSVEAAQARAKINSAEAASLANAMQVQRKTERVRADADQQRQLAASEALRAAAQIERLAHFDSITGLANRTLLLDHMVRAIGRARRQQTRLAVLFLDLDHFKNVNALIGHHGGDRLLKSVADRVVSAMRAESVLARLGGDEFVLMLPDFETEGDSAVAARRIHELLSTPFADGEHELPVSASIGIAVFPDDGLDPDTLLKNAETAMRSVKSAGRNAIQFFAPEMGDAVKAALRLEKRLRTAIEQNAFDLVYQPKVNAISEKITGMEALLRWRDAALDFASPAQFIPVAERLGVISAIGDWALRTACLQNKAWQAAGLPAVPVAVNVSALEFEDAQFLSRIRNALAASALDPRYLEIEITEGSLIKDANSAAVTLHAVKALGVSIAIDDFGTGYSSLAYLGTFPIDNLKIDQSFVRELRPGHHAQEITRTIIGIAKRLNMKVIAEGVETAAQAQFLKDEACDELQGYFYSRPVSADAIASILRDGLAPSLSRVG
ncbi:MAG: EAL domain-containing protein [Betaproteobacteria bacterium]